MTTMVRQVAEFRIVVPGRAVSFRSPYAQVYKKRVALLGRRVLPRPVNEEPVEFLIDYFHSDQRKMDMDNVAKAVMDALNGIAYRDDQQVAVVRARSHYTGEIFSIDGGPADLVKPLAQFSDYLFLRIRRRQPPPVPPRLLRGNDLPPRRARKFRHKNPRRGH